MRSAPARRRAWRRAVYALSRSTARRLVPANGLGLRVAVAVAREAMYWLRPALTRRDLANLALAVPALTRREHRRILRAALGNTARTSLEFLALVDGALTAPALGADLRAQGLEHLDQALAQGRGVIAVSTHLGHFAIPPLWLAARGYPVSIIMREAKHVPTGLYARAMERLGCQGIAADDVRVVARETLRALRAGRVVFLYLDQGVKRAGAGVEFLGKHLPMPEGPAIFARRSGAPIVPVLLDPQARAVRIEPPLDLAAHDDAAAQALADLAAREVRAHPRHWQWRHRRWARE